MGSARAVGAVGTNKSGGMFSVCLVAGRNLLCGQTLAIETEQDVYITRLGGSGEGAISIRIYSVPAW